MCAVGGAGIPFEVLHPVQVYTTLCPCEEDPEDNRNDKIAARVKTQSMRILLFTRTIAVDPGTRTTLHPLHNVRFIDGSLNKGLNDSVLLKLFKRGHIHLDGRFLPNDLQRMNVAPREIIHGFLSSDNASPFSFGCFSGRWWFGCGARSFAWKDTRLIHRVCRRSRRDRTRSTETL